MLAESWQLEKMHNLRRSEKAISGNTRHSVIVGSHTANFAQ